MAGRYHKKLMLTKAGGFERLTHKEQQYPNLVINSQGTVIKDRTGTAPRKATRQEMREATKLGV